jgi:hypothetical protein
MKLYLLHYFMLFTRMSLQIFDSDFYSHQLFLSRLSQKLCDNRKIQNGDTSTK